MYILAYKEGHDPAACLLKDGKIIAAAEEERFNRQKHAPGILPRQAISYCLKFANITASDIDYLVYARLKPYQTLFQVLKYYLSRPPHNKIEFKFFISHLKTQLIGTWQEICSKNNYQKIHFHFPELPTKIYSFDHHLCHAASAYYFSNFDSALILTMDGKGEATSVMAAQGQDNKIKILERRGIFDSFGLFYSAITKHLGFTPNDGEYKVMGLAPYGQPNISFKDILKAHKKTGYSVNSHYSLYPLSLKNLPNKLGPARTRESELKDHHKNIAASAQAALEESTLNLLKHLLKKYPHSNLCLAGGVALNVKMNKKFWESGLIKNLYIQPAAGDNGLVLGAAALLYTRLTQQRVQCLENLYLGPQFENSAIENALQKSKIQYSFITDKNKLIQETVNLLKSDLVVGWYQGRMEFGPRALGNRSILANPQNKTMRAQVNAKIKFREDFRPFCPSILEEFAPSYFKNYTPAPYMILSFVTLSPEIDNKISAVVHVDGTVRPQTVNSEINPLYYELLQEFNHQTGIPALLNTSMNIRGEPIVCSPQDLIEFFLKTEVDAIVAGNFVALKKNQNPAILKTQTREELKTKY